MRIQKTYIWYCVATWSLWIITLVLSLFAGNAFNVRSKALYFVAEKLSGASLLISWVPIHPILFVLAIIFSVKHKREGYTLFNIFGFIFTSILAFFILANHVWLIGGV